MSVGNTNVEDCAQSQRSLPTLSFYVIGPFLPEAKFSTRRSLGLLNFKVSWQLGLPRSVFLLKSSMSLRSVFSPRYSIASHCDGCASSWLPLYTDQLDLCFLRNFKTFLRMPPSIGPAFLLCLRMNLFQVSSLWHGNRYTLLEVLRRW